MQFSNLPTDHCWLCEENRFTLNGELGLPEDVCVVSETNNFVCAVDIAPIISGHLLLSPKRHTLRFDQLTSFEKAELAKILTQVRKRYHLLGHEMFAFEHCSSHPDQARCVSHVHYHLLPVSNLLENQIDELVLLNSSRNLCLKKNIDYIRMVWKGNSSVKLGNQAGQLRLEIEQILSGQSLSWRDRLAVEPESCLGRMTDTINLFASVTSFSS